MTLIIQPYDNRKARMEILRLHYTSYKLKKFLDLLNGWDTFFIQELDYLYKLPLDKYCDTYSEIKPNDDI